MVYKTFFCQPLAAVPFYIHAFEITQDDWMHAIPTAFCKAGQYFRQCLEVSAQKCEKTAASATRGCLNRYENANPSVVNQPEDDSPGAASSAAARAMPVK